MPNILPVLDLRNYNEVLNMKLQEAEETVKDGEGWLSLEELGAAMRENKKELI